MNLVVNQGFQRCPLVGSQKKIRGIEPRKTHRAVVNWTREQTKSKHISQKKLELASLPRVNEWRVPLGKMEEPESGEVV
jgi:hypothetical protein